MKEADECLKLTAADLLSLGVIEKIIPENGKDFTATFQELHAHMSKMIAQNRLVPPEELTARRYARFRKIGV